MEVRSMEQSLFALFDFHRFAPNDALQSIIDETDRRCAARLDDDALSLVAAAGDQSVGFVRNREDGPQ